MIKMGLAELLNRHLPRHGKQIGLDWEWVAVIWLSYIVSQGDHRKVQVREWVKQRRYTIEQVCDLKLRDTDFTDDRLSILLKRLSDDQTWTDIERDLTQKTLGVYDLSVEQVRLDATTISGHDLISDAGLFQFGHSKDDPTLPQVKLMIAMADPLGMPIVTQVMSGEHADEGLYIPAIEQITLTLGTPNLLFVGDCKMSALDTRALIQAQGHCYLSPLALVGKTPNLLQGWVEAAVSGQIALTPVSVPYTTADDPAWVRGYKVCRHLTSIVAGQSIEWQERVFILHSPTLEQQQRQGLEKRLNTAEEKLCALTPTPGQGKRQVKDEALLLQKAHAILQQHRVCEYLSYDYEHQIGNKPRYHITQVNRHQDLIDHHHERCGWRAYVSNAPRARLSFNDAVLTYRDEWIAERGFHRLKRAPLSLAPLFVQRDDQVRRLIRFLSVALRLLTLIEFVVRRQLQLEATMLSGLYPQHPHQQPHRPTAERLLKAFSHLTLTLIDAH